MWKSDKIGNFEESQLNSAWVANVNTRINCWCLDNLPHLSHTDCFHQVREISYFAEACVCDTIKQSNNILLPWQRAIRKYFLFPCSHIRTLEGSSPARPRKLIHRKRLQTGAEKNTTHELSYDGSGRWFCPTLHVSLRETETSEVAGWKS